MDTVFFVDIITMDRTEKILKNILQSNTEYVKNIETKKSNNEIKEYMNLIAEDHLLYGNF